MLGRALKKQPHCHVVWTTGAAADAPRMCVAKPPDLVLLDVDTEGLDGVDVTRRIMAAAPCATAT